jgi:hypothetical protein
LDLILVILEEIKGKEVNEMGALQDLQAAVAAEQTVEKSVITLLQNLAVQLSALEANESGMVAASDVEAVVTNINANAATLAAAVTANTPAAPTS